MKKQKEQPTFSSQYAIFFSKESTFPNRQTKLHSTPADAFREALDMRFASEKAIDYELDKLPIVEQLLKVEEFLIQMFGRTVYLAEF